mmetsp:Transcript_26530/g.56402  ORF Transcript_26530/g.56402 Transcript_26530/m.56402 type:complete len:612 (-) Transcript_26530:1061-2896(-)
MTSRAMRQLFQAAFIGLACSCAVPAFQTIPGYVQVEAPSPTFASSSTLSSSLSSSLRLFHDTSAFFDGRPSSRLSFLLRLSAEAQEEEEEVEEELKFPPNIISSSTPKPNENNSSEQHDRQKSFQQGGLQLNQRRWVFRDKYPIAYEVATDATPWRRESEHEKESDTDVVPILLLNGFGVGSFHQHRLMRRLLLERRAKNNHRKQNVRYLVYGIDYLGQGQSWPAFCDDGNSPDEFQLSYSADTWIEQLGLFLRDVVLADAANNDGDSPRKAHIVGNSVGGYLAAVLSSLHPHLVSTVALLNATPVWGLNLPFWDGKLPAPFVPRRVGRALFDVIREEGTIDRYLEAAYATRGAYDGTFHDGFGDESSTGDGRGVEGDGGLGKKIRACTEGKGGHAAFASILWSAPASAPDFFSAEGHLQQQQQQQPTMKQQQQQQQQKQWQIPRCPHPQPLQQKTLHPASSLLFQIQIQIHDGRQRRTPPPTQRRTDSQTRPFQRHRPGQNTRRTRIGNECHGHQHGGIASQGAANAARVEETTEADPHRFDRRDGGVAGGRSGDGIPSKGDGGERDHFGEGGGTESRRRDHSSAQRRDRIASSEIGRCRICHSIRRESI